MRVNQNPSTETATSDASRLVSDTVEVLIERCGRVGCITLNRPRALNALTLGMVRQMLAALQQWAVDPEVDAVLLRGQGRSGDGSAPFGVLCAGGDIRFVHQAVLAGDPRVEDFFTEEYALNYLIHTYPKPYVAFMDGVVMGGGMGISQGAGLRIVTERTQMAMPETAIGLFPDVGGGYFLSRTPGHAGEYLALTGCSIDAADAVELGLADVVLDSAALPALWRELQDWRWPDLAALRPTLAARARPLEAGAISRQRPAIDRFFAAADVPALIRDLEAAKGPDAVWATQTAAVLRRRSPLMLHVVLEQLRRARQLTLAEDLRLERGLVRHCLSRRPGAEGETLEGIRARVIDKDQQPRWQPACIEDVAASAVAAYFESPWPANSHPLRGLERGDWRG